MHENAWACKGFVWLGAIDFQLIESRSRLLNEINRHLHCNTKQSKHMDTPRVVSILFSIIPIYPLYNPNITLGGSTYFGSRRKIVP